MTEKLAHRGPDDFGYWELDDPAAGSVLLGSRRLSILDLSPAGHMPMTSGDGRFTITYNGEVYNHQELRQGLLEKGHRFRSKSDTETVLCLYQEYGAECVTRLNGMFAFAIWDASRKCLFVARDHFGIKPFYYFHRGRQFAFSSELHSLLETPELSRDLDWQALDQYLTFLWVPEPGTMLKGISKLPPGHSAVLKDGNLVLDRYWGLEIPDERRVRQEDTEDLLEELRSRFRNSVRSQMLSDVPIGAFLSAGLDSSSIIAMMAEASSRPVKTFTITFPERDRAGVFMSDDPAVARRTAEHFGCDHHEIVVSPDVAELLPKLVLHTGDPLADPAIIMAYLVSEEARKSVTVLLSGVGGDEVFGGYRKYQAHEYSRLYQTIPAAVRRYLVEPAMKRLPSLRGTGLQQYVRLAKKMARSGSLTQIDRFLMDSVYFTDELKATLYTNTFHGECSPSEHFVRNTLKN